MESKTESIRHLLDATAKWKDVAHEELRDWQRTLEEKEDVAEYHWNNVANEAYMVEKTERLMYANIAVSLFALSEDFLRVLCLNLDATEIHRRIKDIARPNWGHFRNILEQECGIKYDKIEHFDTMDRVRLFNNCFKHNSGRPNDEYRRKYGGDYIEEIEYEKEDWDTIISNCEAFLLELADHVREVVKTA